MGLPWQLSWEIIACNAGDLSSIPGSGRSPGEGIGYPLQNSWASLVAQMVKNLPAKQEIWVRSLGLEDSPEECMATYSSILAWRILMDRGAWFNICLHVNNEWLKFKINELKDILMQIHSIFIYKCSITCVLFTQSCWLFASPWTVAHQAPLSTGFSRQE